MIVIASVIAFAFLLLLFPGFYFSGPRYKGPVTDHFNGRTFSNPGNVQPRGMRDVLRWMSSRRRGPWNVNDNPPIGEKPVDSIVKGFRITFVNHSTFLIQTAGLNILTDPIWSKRASPFEWAGPLRKRPPGIRLEDLPKIDLVLLSHNHWDHLDIKTLIKIYRKDYPRIVAPLGVGKILNNRNISTFKDMDWWDRADVFPAIEITAVPAQHSSARGIFDRDATLWAGYIIRTIEGSLYFAGDTGYSPSLFKEIARRCPPIDVSIIPIGAYKPEWFMSPVHCNPYESVKIHNDLNSRISIACHFGTFPLADEGGEEPLRDLKRAMEESGVSPDAFIALREGFPKDFNPVLP